MAADAVSVLERVYDFGQPPDRWLGEVVEAAVPFLDFGNGVQGYFADVGPWGVRARGFYHSGGRDPAPVEMAFHHVQQLMTPEYLRLVHRIAPCSLGSRLPVSLLGATGDPLLAAMGFQDVFGVNGLDASGSGCVLAAWVPVGHAVGDGPPTSTWCRLAAHMAAGVRLLRRNNVSFDAAEAVLSPSGRVEHAEGPAQNATAIERLRLYAVAMDRARTRAVRSDAEEATRLWGALAAGRWSILDRFDHDGRRYLLAVPNEAEVPVQRPLSRREEQAVGYASLGHGDKLIAYEMGLAQGTVARLLSRAREKMGVGTRTEMITRWLARGAS